MSSIVGLNLGDEPFKQDKILFNVEEKIKVD
jgi:hypothetical protein